MEEAELARRYALRTERFEHGALRVDLLLPRTADELIDDDEFERDERLPYWAELWPSARALARELIERGAPHGRALELGCGLGLPSLALRWLGTDVLATDYYADALEFARLNAERNGLGPLPTALLDWRDPPTDLGRFELVLAADVLYEQRNAEMLQALLPRLLAPGGRAWIADPGRAYRSDFERAMRADGWSVSELVVREERATHAVGDVRGRITILELRPPAGTPR